MLKIGNSLSLSAAKTTYSNDFSILFDGTNDYIQLDAAAASFSACKLEGTFACWVKSVAQSGSGTLFRAVADASNEIFIFWHNSSDEWRFTYEAGGTGKKVQHSAGTTDSDDAWHFFTMTWSASADALKAYIDASQVGSDVGSLGDFSGDITAVDIGQNTSGGAYFKGIIDEVAIWNEALTAAEITAIYNSGKTINVSSNYGNYTSAANLKGYWRFNEGTGTTAIDHPQNNLVGTLTNSPAYSTTTV